LQIAANGEASNFNDCTFAGYISGSTSDPGQLAHQQTLPLPPRIYTTDGKLGFGKTIYQDALLTSSVSMAGWTHYGVALTSGSTSTCILGIGSNGQVIRYNKCPYLYSKQLVGYRTLTLFYFSAAVRAEC
jgi:hypothetical protein